MFTKGSFRAWQVHNDFNHDPGRVLSSLLAPEASEEVTVCKCIAVVTTVNLQASPPRNSRLNSMKYIHGMKYIMTMLMIRSPHTTHSASSAIHQVWLLLRLPADSTSNPDRWYPASTPLIHSFNPTADVNECT